MKKKTTYIWMGAIVGLTVVLFAVIYFFHLQDSAVQTASSLNGGKPTISRYIIGDMSNPLDKPMDVTKSNKYIYVTDTNHKQVQVFDSSSGKPAFKFGKQGTGEGEFQFPYGIAVDNKDNVYVADLYNSKISVFTADGKFIKYFTDNSKNASFVSSPAGLRIYDKKLFITDIKTSKVLEYSLDGKKLLELSTATASDDTLSAPNGVAIDDQNIYVSDSGNQRIVVFDKKGKFLRLINGSKAGKGDSKFVNPRGIAVQPNGTLLMVDSMTHYVYGFDKNGKQKFEFGGLGSGNDQFYLPNGLFIDDQGKIFITDTVNARVAQYN